MSSPKKPDWDLVVVGGGGCGLATSIAAVEGRLRVRLLEKTDHLGGNTARSVGSVPGAGTRFQADVGIADSPELFYEDLRRRADGQLDESSTRLMCGLSAELVHWLVDSAGVTLRLTEDYKHVAHSVNRLHNPPSREGAELIADLERTARERGVTIDLSSPVTGLQVDDGSVDIRVGSSGDSDSVVTSRAVVLATDGFGASNELKQQYCPDTASLPYFGAESNTGDGIRWGRDLGARLANMDSYLGYAVMAVPPGGAPTYQTLFSWTVLEIGGIAVDRNGRRFGDEDAGYSAFSDTVLHDGGGRAFVVFDQRILDSVTRHEPRFKSLVERLDSPVRCGADVGALAHAYGLPAENLQATLETYSQAARGDTKDVFGRRTFGLAPLQGTLYVCETRPGLLTTQGGLVVNSNAQVVLEDGTTLSNVYAGGSTAAGISGNRGAQGYASGNGLLTALGYGLLAGRHAAAFKAGAERLLRPMSATGSQDERMDDI